jgi:hypothetical protein
MTNAERKQPEAERKQPVRDAAASAKSAETSPRATGGMTEEEIRTRAYELYRARGGRGGDSTSDWLTAEREHRESVGPSAQATADTPSQQGAQ